MTRTIEPLVIPNSAFPGARFPEPATGNRIFRALALLTIWLEIVVLFEPAPVDVLIVGCLLLGLLLRTLDFAAVGSVPMVALAVFAIANLVSMYDPFDLTRAVWYVFVTLYLVASWFFFVGLLGRFGESMLASSIQAYCLAGVVSAFLGAGGYFHFLPDSDTFLLAGRARGLFKDCNVYGPYFVPMALFALIHLMDVAASVRTKLLSFVFFLSAVLAMLLCFSRACWLNFVVALLVFFGGLWWRSRGGSAGHLSLRTVTAILIVGTIGVVALLQTEAVKDMLALRITSSGLQDYDRVRFATQDQALEMAQRRPLGIGPGQSEVILEYATHSMYMRVLIENGLIALLALLAFIGATMVRAWKQAATARTGWLRSVHLVVFACIAGHLVNSFFIDTVHWRHIWFIYALPWLPLHARGYAQRLWTNSWTATSRKPAYAVSRAVERWRYSS